MRGTNHVLRILTTLTVLLLTAAQPRFARGELKPAAMFSDHMCSSATGRCLCGVGSDAASGGDGGLRRANENVGRRHIRPCGW